MRTTSSSSTVISFASVVFALTACGGSDEPDYAHGTINNTSAEAAIEGISEIGVAIQSGDGETSASGVLGLTAIGQTLVIPSGPSGAGRLQAPPLGLVPQSLGRDGLVALTGTASCDDTGCVYDNFGDDTEYGSYRINGFIRKTGDTFAFDLTFDLTSSGYTFDWSIDGSITVSPTLIDGEIHSHGSSTGDGYAISWDVDLDFDQIGLDGSGCPTSGRLAARVAYDVSGTQGSGNYAVAGAVTFGPACGQFSAE